MAPSLCRTSLGHVPSERAVGTAALLVRACHPEPTLAVTGVTALLAWDAGTGPGRGALVTAAVFTGQLSIGWSNDLVDARRDRAVARADKPLATGALAVRAVIAAVVVALIGCATLSLLCGLASGLTHLALGVGSGWMYNLVAKRTAWSWLPYALAFGSLPAVVSLAARPPALAPWWLLLAGAMLGIGAHLVNALPDLADDATTGVRGLPHILGRAASQRTATAVLVIASLATFAGPWTRPPLWCWAGLVIVFVVAVVGLRSSDRVAFHATVAIAAVGVVMLTSR
jgi:4-hydroxybenzoate polyprenyltransferase